MVSIAASGAFMEVFDLPPLASGPLDGLTFAVKDLIDVAGRRTGCGNRRWRETHPPAAVNAVCVDQLLLAGARGVGKTITDQLAFSLLGENYHYGTPLNPRAPDRVPGGSSSGSASAVACGLADFALGTDTGGSVRVPAGNCGLFGLRTTHGRVSLGGVAPLSLSFDTVGLFTREIGVLARAAPVLLAQELPARAEVGTIHLVREAFALADAGVQTALEAPVNLLREAYNGRVQATSLRDIDREEGVVGMDRWRQAFGTLQWAEAWSTLGAWLEAEKPDLGPLIGATFERLRALDRSAVPAAIRRREEYCRRLGDFLGPADLLCIPTAAAPAPLKGSSPGRDEPGGYYPRTLNLTSLAGIGRLPQLSLPLAESEGAPVGLSLLAARGNDGLLIRVAETLAAAG